MAEKGARAELEPLVRQKYIETGNLSQAAETYGISRQSAAEWKARTRKPGADLDEWDKARERKGDHYQRMQLLFDRQITFIEDLTAQQVTPAMVDALSKLGALVEKTEKIVAAARRQALDEAAVAVEKAATQQGLNKEQAQFWREQVLGVGQ